MQNQKNTAEICGKNYEVESFVRLKDKDGNSSDEVIPVVDIPQMSDYKYQLMSLESRIKHPEYYEKTESVSGVMEGLKAWLLERTTEALHLQFQNEYKQCFNFMMQRS